MESADERRLLDPAARVRPVMVKVTNVTADVDTALEIVHRGFVAAGYSEPRPSGRRMHPSYLHPGTVFALASIDRSPAGTVATVPDGPFGLPSDRAFAEELDEVRTRGPVHEVGSLVIDETFRRHTRRVYMHLLAGMVRQVIGRDDETQLVMSVTPENARLTATLLCCDVIAAPRPLFGAPAVLLYTSSQRLRACHEQADTKMRREIRRLVFEPDPSWLTIELSPEPWDRSWWLPLLREEGTADRLRNQLRVLTAQGSRVSPQELIPD